MKPLQAVAMGLVVVLLTASVHGYDVLPDPIGWGLVLGGLVTLPVVQRQLLRTLATVSLVVSVLIWFPPVRDALNVTDPSLAWAAGIPEVVTLIVLAHALAQAAGAASDQSARRWFKTTRTLLVIVLLIPPVVLGAGLDASVPVASVFSSLTLLLMILLLFFHAGRPWAVARVDAPAR